MEIRRKNKLIEIFDAKRIIVFGDLHGDFDSFSKVYDFLDKDCLIIFLGDYADRGDFGVEILESLNKLLKENKNVIALKGNHESYDEYGNPNFRPCDLREEVSFKRGNWLDYYNNFLKDFFFSLPIAAIYEDKYLFIHGGVSRKISSRKILENPSSEIEEIILWSDPFEGKGEAYNPRGAGVLFGKDVTEDVLKKLNVRKIVRSHEPQKALNGYFYSHNNKVLTISSTRVYGGKPVVLEIVDDKENFIEL